MSAVRLVRTRLLDDLPDKISSMSRTSHEYSDQFKDITVLERPKLTSR